MTNTGTEVTRLVEGAMTGQNPRIGLRLVSPSGYDTREVSEAAELATPTRKSELLPHQHGLTLLLPIREGQAEKLKELLDTQLSVKRQAPSLIDFEQLHHVHFLRMLVLDADTRSDGEPMPAYLVYSSCYDGHAAAHLQELTTACRDHQALMRICLHCEGFDAIDHACDSEIQRYLLSHKIGINTLYLGTRGFTVKQIQRDAALHNSLQERLDQLMADSTSEKSEPDELRQELQKLVLSDEQYTWIKQAPLPKDKFAPRTQDGLMSVGVLVLFSAFLYACTVFGLGRAMLGFAVLASLPLLVFARMLRKREKSDLELMASVDKKHIVSLVSREDHIAQNQMSSLTVVKQGAFRRLLLIAVLFAVDRLGRYVFIRGKLAGIPSIHYARWLTIDKGRRLLFLSNFDGSWENYIGDFIDKAATGLTAIWSNAYGFPRTRWLTLGGARDEQRFKAYVRASQVPTQFWYSAYPKLTVVDIRRNARIRAGLLSKQTTEQTRQWLSLL